MCRRSMQRAPWSRRKPRLPSAWPVLRMPLRPPRRLQLRRRAPAARLAARKRRSRLQPRRARRRKRRLALRLRCQPQQLPSLARRPLRSIRNRARRQARAAPMPGRARSSPPPHLPRQRARRLSLGRAQRWHPVLPQPQAELPSPLWLVNRLPTQRRRLLRALLRQVRRKLAGYRPPHRPPRPRRRLTPKSRVCSSCSRSRTAS
jgi:hypothetical protein